MRYCALWTDPNFLGGFCLISICYLLRMEKPNIIVKAIIYGMCALIFYYGTLTLSRTYLVVAIAMVAFFVLFVQSSGNSMRKVFISIAVLVVAFFAITKYIDRIAENRIVGSEGATGGRAEATLALLDLQMNDATATFFGVGYDNTISLLKSTSMYNVAHNTYVEILLQFGLVGLFLFIMIFFSNFKNAISILKSVRTPYGLPMACLLFYLGTLSALKYEFLFFIVAIFMVEHRRSYAN